MRELAGKAAFVTGGASGIGLALGRAFAAAGMRVMLADIEAAALAKAVAALRDAGSDVRGVACDVADPASVEQAARITVRTGAPGWRSGLPPSCQRWMRRLRAGPGRRRPDPGAGRDFLLSQGPESPMAGVHPPSTVGRFLRRRRYCVAPAKRRGPA
jgi:NAD(P)-dependent dehydrogenase (short-subunit alcohol dehydrogenase family)